MTDTTPSTRPGTLAVVILTYNEEANLPQPLASVTGWADEVFVFDSFSTDRTVEMARAQGAQVVQHPFENYAAQRNAALDKLPITSEWILFLDADEWLPQALKEEIRALIARHPSENGFYIKRRLIWMGRWIRRGYYPTWILRLFRRGKGRCEERGVNEHLLVEPPLGYLRHDFMHEDRKDLTHWVTKHVQYARREAEELWKREHGVAQTEINANLFGTQAERKRWLRRHVWERLPPFVRPWFYFLYRYLIRGGFRDGRAGFVFHFMHALWFPMLIDAFYLERLVTQRPRTTDGR
jgi:glycosyltransferase involved in cell wall biosynthesis